MLAPRREHELSRLWRAFTEDILTIMYIDLRVICLLILSYFNQNRNMLMNVSTNSKHILWKSVQWESRFSLRTDRPTKGQTDMTGLIVAFRRCFAKGPKSTAYSILCAQRLIWNNRHNKICVTIQQTFYLRHLRIPVYFAGQA